MTNKEQKIKEASDVELVCADCGLPIAGERPRTDVTRYLSDISRCSCRGSAEPSSQSIAGQGRVSLEEASSILAERFDVIEFLGEGGMGSVFKARDKNLRRIVAVKILNPRLIHDQQSVKRFEQEARAAIALTHAHLAAVYEYGIGSNNTPFLVMDFLEGSTLEDLLKVEKWLDYKRAIDIFIQICEAVHYAHLKGVIHRDIKPSNIIVMRKSAGVEFAKLFDFGIAKVLPNQGIDFTQDMTQTGELFGSPLYMSPEQCKGFAVDGRSDIHALGCVMYKALAGVHPYEGKNFVDTVVKIITTDPAKISQLAPGRIPANLEQVIMRCLSKDAEYRYQNAAELQADLERIRDGKPIKSFKQKPASAGKLKQIVLIGSSIVALVAGVFIFGTVSGIGPGARTTVPTNPYGDAERLDSLAYSYYVKGDYARAIPLLEFGVNTYKKNGKTKVGNGREDNYLAENLAHIGECYLKLGKFSQAVPYYRDSLKIFQQWGNYPGGMMGQAVTQYAEVLRGLKKDAESQKMLDEFHNFNNIKNIP